MVLVVQGWVQCWLGLVQLGRLSMGVRWQRARLGDKARAKPLRRESTPPAPELLGAGRNSELQPKDSSRLALEGERNWTRRRAAGESPEEREGTVETEG